MAPACFPRHPAPAPPQWPALPQSTACPIPVDSRTCNHSVAHFGNYFLFLEDSCFPVLYWFLPCITMKQPQVFTYPLPLEPPPAPRRIPPLGLVTGPRVERLRLCGNFLVALWLACDAVCFSVPLSRFSPPSPAPTVSSGLFSI